MSAHGLGGGHAFGHDDDDELLSEINMVPLIDIMLVLLVVFIITMPVLHHAVNVQLPIASSQVQRQQPADAAPLKLGIDAQGQYTINGQPVANWQALKADLSKAAKQQPQPALHIQADQNARYDAVAKLMSVARQAGLVHLAFVTLPDEH
jgi:biopolymer transport protein ExbD